MTRLATRRLRVKHVLEERRLDEASPCFSETVALSVNPYGYSDVFKKQKHYTFPLLNNTVNVG